MSERVILWTLVISSLSISAWSGMEVIRLRSAVRDVYCDARDSVSAERQFVYPILRGLGQRPDDNAKDVRNPLTTSSGRFKVGPDECSR